MFCNFWLCISDLKLKCGDCKNTQSSAALLLQHFAQHVTGQYETDHRSSGKREYPHCRLLCKKKKKSESILESVMKVNDTTPSSSEPSPFCGTDSSTISAFSDYQESSSDNSSVLHINPSKSPRLEESCISADENIRVDNHTPLSLVRFDLQKRLENCVMNLSNKKCETLNNNVSDSDQLEICQSIKKEIKNEDVTTETSISGGTNEEFNPLKFCMITMEDNKECIMNNIKETKKTTSRKQLIPKKIEQNIRKIAPKPNDAPKNQDNINSKLSQKKKYPCHLCSKVFGWSTDLKRHILVHTGERPFKCKTCLASFTRNFLLQKHQSKVHPCSPPKKTSISTPIETKFIPISNTELKLQEQTVVIKIEKSESEDDIDEDDDEDRLVITEPFEDEETNNFQHIFQNTVDSKWTTISSSAERRCSNIEHSDMFSMGQMKVVTM